MGILVEQGLGKADCRHQLANARQFRPHIATMNAERLGKQAGATVRRGDSDDSGSWKMICAPPRNHIRSRAENTKDRARQAARVPSVGR